MCLPAKIVVDGHPKILDGFLLRDGCTIDLDINKLCPWPGCSPAKDHHLGFANVQCHLVRLYPGGDELKISVSGTCYNVRIPVA